LTAAVAMYFLAASLTNHQLAGECGLELGLKTQEQRLEFEAAVGMLPHVVLAQLPRKN